MTQVESLKAMAFAQDHGNVVYTPPRNTARTLNSVCELAAISCLLVEVLGSVTATQGDVVRHASRACKGV